MEILLKILFIILITGCTNKDDSPMYDGQILGGDNQSQNNGSQNTATGCSNTPYSDWMSSIYVLPYPVGTRYQVQLSHCTSSYHSPGQPDQFAIDFKMPIGTIVTAAREGEVIRVIQSGEDGGFPNNLVIIHHEGDNTFAQYMHLTNQGAAVAVGDMIRKGDTIGYSGATGLAGYPHLHFVVTKDAWQYPYTSVPYNFKNTTANPRSLQSGVYYTAEPY